MSHGAEEGKEIMGPVQKTRGGTQRTRPQKNRTEGPKDTGHRVGARQTRKRIKNEGEKMGKRKGTFKGGRGAG